MMSISKKILAGGIIFSLILALLLSINSYRRFTTIIVENHSRDALRTAHTALQFVDAENFSDYVQDESNFQDTLLIWQRLVDTQAEMFIYVIEPIDNYNNIRFDINVKNTNANYATVPRGNVRPTSSDEYKEAYRDIYERGKDYSVVVRDNGISNTGDHLTIIIPIRDGNNAVKGLLCVQRQMEELDQEKILFLQRTIAVTLIVMLLMLLIGRYCLKTQLLNPLDKLTQGVKEISGGNLDKKLNIKTGDEIQTLAESFNTMTDDLNELDVARRIQISMLPKNFSVDERVDLFATMTPAKEVGGDLYDFYMLDENHLFITIADVSGKGIPAALFMVAAITNLRNSVTILQNPDDLKSAIEHTNDRLCANNDGGLFVTVFSGVLDLTTGVFRYVNAGHNPPLIRRHVKIFFELPMELNFVLGGWDDWQYVQQEIQLAAGDTIFLYTDGVTEAINSDGKMYSLERLQKKLANLDKAKSAEEILTVVSNSLEKFSGDAEQSDDITMLAVKFERSY